MAMTEVKSRECSPFYDPGGDSCSGKVTHIENMHVRPLHQKTSESQHIPDEAKTMQGALTPDSRAQKSYHRDRYFAVIW